jgi:hypothetical protein
MDRVVWTVVAAAVLWAAGCGNRSTNPIGGDLIARDPGQVVMLPALGLSAGAQKFGGVTPVVAGGFEELLVGRMNGLVFRSLLRFRVDADSLARALGVSWAGAAEVNTFRLYLKPGVPGIKGGPDLAVSRPLSAWDETSVFSDSLSLEEIEMPATALPTASASLVGDSIVVVDLPAALIQDVLAGAAGSDSVDVLLHPSDGSDDFLTSFVSREGVLLVTPQDRPRFELTYSLAGDSLRYEGGASLDTYWGARDGDGPEPGTLLLASGIRYDPILRFDLPDTIPAGATINSVRLEVDLDQDRSFLSVFPFQIGRLEVLSASGDTTYANYDNPDEVQQFVSGASTSSFLIYPPLIQSWLSKSAPNHGLALRAQDLQSLGWVLLLNPRLRIIYSLPPRLGPEGRQP